MTLHDLGNGIEIYQGHVLDILQKLPDESVHCVVTSPPYWGLRDYGLPPVVWGGQENHAHTWGAEIPLMVSSRLDHLPENLTGGQKRHDLGRARSRGSF